MARKLQAAWAADISAGVSFPIASTPIYQEEPLNMTYKVEPAEVVLNADD
jgi:hypothetical protein